MPATFTQQLATVTVTWSEHTFTIPDLCPNPKCNAPLLGPGASFTEQQWVMSDAEVYVEKDDGQPPGIYAHGEEGYSDSVVSVGYECLLCLEPIYSTHDSKKAPAVPPSAP
ncbi:hypothetical protein [Corallococcus sp. AB038B]|uniref:hypothetical protein n=1 Tax=Corallococcus sp. AB038B TaxID=2316718 RepID=UPI000EC868B2|nr:hypothetical protein [Corallococcus sp. AB038B]RKH92793.1 hypothetical protein D7Y04_42375 [Corallococcus sp. AB038B]